MADPQSIADVLSRAADLCEKGWCTLADARNSDGVDISPMAVEASRFCMSGAIRRACNDEFDLKMEARDSVRRFLGTGVEFFNDTRTQSEVVSALRSAAAKAQTETLTERNL